MNKRIIALSLAALLFFCMAGCANRSGDAAASASASEYASVLFDKGVVTINIITEESDWDYLLKNAESEPWISCNIEIDGVSIENVGVRTKGNSSLSHVARMNSHRYSLKLKFDKFVKEQSYCGLDELSLNNCFKDSTYLKEFMSYDLFRYMDVPCSLCTFAEIRVNGIHHGFFLAVEDVDSAYLDRHYGVNRSIEAYKPDTAGNRGGNGGVNLVYSNDSINSYSNIFDNAITNIDETDQLRLIASLKGISEGEKLEKYVNVDEVLRYAACNVFLVNLDSYFSSMGHNYILIENSGALSMLPWDYNESFGTHKITNSSEAVNYAIDTIFSNVSPSERPIIGKLLENEEYLERYHEYLRQIAEDYVQSGRFGRVISDTDEIIREYVESDTTSFYGYPAYQEGVDALRLFGTLRAESVIGQLNGNIPSTALGQRGSRSLIDAASLDLSKLSGDGGLPGGNPPSNRPSNRPSNGKNRTDYS